MPLSPLITATTMAALPLASILVLFLTAASLSPPATSVPCDAADKATLLKIKAELGRPPHLSSWNPATDCCSWEGILCEMFTGQTLGINLTGAAISSAIPPSIGRLPVLSYLTFADIPSLTGPIPTSLAKHPFLKQLTITHTALAGPIPPFLGDMPQLGSLDLSHNRLSGAIPNNLTGWMFYSIDLSHNTLTGPIPASVFVGSISDPALSLSHNRLTGGIPRELGKVDFGTIDLSANGLTGDASFLFGARKRAVRIDLSRNMLGFDMSGLVMPPYLEALDLSHNQIRGRVPRSVAGLKRLVSFDVNGNQLCGRIPAGRRMSAFGAQSYAGNKCLCGKPLPACGDRGAQEELTTRMGR